MSECEKHGDACPAIPNDEAIGRIRPAPEVVAAFIDGDAQANEIVRKWGGLFKEVANAEFDEQHGRAPTVPEMLQLSELMVYELVLAMRSSEGIGAGTLIPSPSPKSEVDSVCQNSGDARLPLPPIDHLGFNQEWFRETAARVRVLRASLPALFEASRDVERLDWMSEQRWIATNTVSAAGEEVCEICAPRIACTSAPTLREAIDAARSSGETTTIQAASILQSVVPAL